MISITQFPNWNNTDDKAVSWMKWHMKLLLMFMNESCAWMNDSTRRRATETQNFLQLCKGQVCSTESFSKDGNRQLSDSVSLLEVLFLFHCFVFLLVQRLCLACWCIGCLWEQTHKSCFTQSFKTPPMGMLCIWNVQLVIPVWRKWKPLQ